MEALGLLSSGLVMGVTPAPMDEASPSASCEEVGRFISPSGVRYISVGCTSATGAGGVVRWTGCFLTGSGVGFSSFLLAHEAVSITRQVSRVTARVVFIE